MKAGKDATPEQIAELRRICTLKRNARRKREQAQRASGAIDPDADLELRARFRDRKEIQRRIEIVRRAKAEYLATHGTLKLPTKVLDSLGLGRVVS